MDSKSPERIIADETGQQRTLGYVHHLYGDRCETIMEMDDRHTNRHGGLHGGINAILLDSACGFAASRAWSDDGSQLVVTLSLTTNFLAPAKSGPIKAIGRVSHAGQSVAYADGQVFDGNGILIATGSGVFKRVRNS